MIDNIPGTVGDQILINSKRLSAKANSTGDDSLIKLLFITSDREADDFYWQDKSEGGVHCSITTDYRAILR
jgi:hypothetical protein